MKIRWPSRALRITHLPSGGGDASCVAVNFESIPWHEPEKPLPEAFGLMEATSKERGVVCVGAGSVVPKRMSGVPTSRRRNRDMLQF
jgi:hypothetical protein